MSEISVAEKAPRAQRGKTSESFSSPVLSETKYLLIASGKGGSGKTTFSSNFATAAVAEGRKVALIDLDGQQTLAKWWSRRPEDLPEIDCFGGKMASAMNVFDGLEAYHLVIIDTPPSLDDYPDQTRQLIEKADFIIIPTGTGKFETESVIEFMAAIRKLSKPAAFVLTKVNRRAGSFLKAKQLLNAAGRLCPMEVPLYEDIGFAAEVGVGVSEIKGARGADDVTAVWTFVKQELGL